MADINLIPQVEKQEQAKERAVKNSTIISLLLFLVVAGASGYVFFTIFSLKSAIQDRDNKIAVLRSDIEGMSTIEISARNLGQKSDTVASILKTRPNYSLLLTEFKKRIPSTILVDSFTLGRDSTASVSGTGSDYISIARFIRDLPDPAFPSAGQGLGSLFTDVSLNSVNLDAQDGNAAFFIVITFDENSLRKVN